MISNSSIISSAEMVTKATEFFDLSGNEISSVWKKVVSKIGKKDDEDTEVISIGERLAANSKVIDLKNGILFIETTHPGWNQQLKMYQKFIINGIKWALPDLKISTFGFRVAGSKATLSEIYDNQFEKSQKDMNKKIDRIDDEIRNKINDESKGGASQLPPELFQKLENLKNSMLTNTKN